MTDDLQQILDHYRRQGAPTDQTALIALLKELQAIHGGSVPPSLLEPIAQAYGIRESLLTAIIRRIPSLRLGEGHLLEICAGSNCRRHAALAAYAQSLPSDRVRVRFVPCMRRCGQGPNIRWDGTLYSCADEALLKKLIQEAKGSP